MGLGFGVWDFGCRVSGLRGTFQTLGILAKYHGAEPSLEHDGGLHLRGSTGRNFHEKLWPRGGEGGGSRIEARAAILFSRGSATRVSAVRDTQEAIKESQT